MRLVVLIGLGVALFVLAVSLLAGALAPFWPYLDLANQFRLLWLAGAVLATVLAAAIRARRLLQVGVVLTLLNALPVLLALAYLPASATASTLKITSLNVWVGNRNIDAVVDFLSASGSDIVVLQEVDARLEAALLPRLRENFPHVVSCASRNCGLMLLSRKPWLESNSQDRGGTVPPLVWASFAGEKGPFRVVGLHLAFPFQPQFQAGQIAYLSERFASASEPTVLVGDFNLGPFTWKLNRLLMKTGFRRHLTFAASWPANRLTPIVLLDNLLASKEFDAVGSQLGPRVGSDHLPVTFEMSLN